MGSSLVRKKLRISELLCSLRRGAVMSFLLGSGDSTGCAEMGGNRPEGVERVVESGRTLRDRPGRQLDADRSGGPVHIEHLTVDAKGQNHLAAGKRHPELMPVMSARHSGFKT